MRRITYILAIIAVITATSFDAFAQRTLGGRRLRLDDGTAPVRSIDLENRNRALLVGTNNNAAYDPNSSAIFFVDGLGLTGVNPALTTPRGVLFAPMTTADQLSIVGPATGLLVFNTDNNQYEFYNGFGWQNIGGGWALTGNNLPIGGGTQLGENFIGTVNAQDFVIATNTGPIPTGAGQGERIRVTAAGDVGIGTTGLPFFPAVNFHVGGVSPVGTGPNTSNVRMNYLGGTPQMFPAINLLQDGIVMGDIDGDLTKYDVATVVGAVAWLREGNEITDGDNLFGTLNTGTTLDVQMITNSLPVMYLSSTQQVGIGNSAPATTLDVTGTFNSTGSSTVATTAGTTNTFGNGGAGTTNTIGNGATLNTMGTGATQNTIGNAAGTNTFGDAATVSNSFGFDAPINGFGNVRATNQTNTYGSTLISTGNVVNNFGRSATTGTVTNNIGDELAGGNVITNIGVNGATANNVGNALATNTVIGLTNINQSSGLNTNIANLAAATTNIGFTGGTNNINGITNINVATTNPTNIGTGAASTVSVGIVGGTNNVAGTTNINASINAPTNINTGTSTGAVTIGNMAAAVSGVTIQSGTSDVVVNTTNGAGSDLVLNGIETVPFTGNILWLTSPGAEVRQTLTADLAEQGITWTNELGVTRVRLGSLIAGNGAGSNPLTSPTRFVNLDGNILSFNQGAGLDNVLSINGAGTGTITAEATTNINTAGALATNIGTAGGNTSIGLLGASTNTIHGNTNTVRGTTNINAVGGLNTTIGTAGGSTNQMLGLNNTITATGTNTVTGNTDVNVGTGNTTNIHTGAATGAVNIGNFNAGSGAVNISSQTADITIATFNGAGSDVVMTGIETVPLAGNLMWLTGASEVRQTAAADLAEQGITWTNEGGVTRVRLGSLIAGTGAGANPITAPTRFVNLGGNTVSFNQGAGADNVLSVSGAGTGTITAEATTNINTAGTLPTSIGTAGGNTTIGNIGASTNAISGALNTVLGTTNINAAGGANTTIGTLGASTNAINGTANSMTASATNSIIAPTNTIEGLTNINASINSNTNINTGTSTGSVAIGNGIGTGSIALTAVNNDITITTDGGDLTQDLILAGTDVAAFSGNLLWLTGASEVRQTAPGNLAEQGITWQLEGGSTLIRLGGTNNTQNPITANRFVNITGPNVLTFGTTAGNAMMTMTGGSNAVAINTVGTGATSIGTTAAGVTILGAPVNINNTGGQTTNIAASAAATTNIGFGGGTNNVLGTTNINVTGGATTSIATTNVATVAIGTAGGTNTIAGNTTINNNINNTTQINTGTSTGAVTIGSGAGTSGSVLIQAGSTGANDVTIATVNGAGSDLVLTGIETVPLGGNLLWLTGGSEVRQTAFTDLAEQGLIWQNEGGVNRVRLGVRQGVDAAGTNALTAARTVYLGGQIMRFSDNTDQAYLTLNDGANTTQLGFPAVTANTVTGTTNAITASVNNTMTGQTGNTIVATTGNNALTATAAQNVITGQTGNQLVATTGNNAISASAAQNVITGQTGNQLIATTGNNTITAAGATNALSSLNASVTTTGGDLTLSVPGAGSGNDLRLGTIDLDNATTFFLTMDAAPTGNVRHRTGASLADEGLMFQTGAIRLGANARNVNPYLQDRFVSLSNGANGFNIHFTGFDPTNPATDLLVLDASSGVNSITAIGTTNINATGTASTSIGTAGGATTIGSAASTNTINGATTMNTGPITMNPAAANDVTINLGNLNTSDLIITDLNNTVPAAFDFMVIENGGADIVHRINNGGLTEQGITFNLEGINTRIRLGGLANTDNPFLANRFINLDAFTATFTGMAGANNIFVLDGNAANTNVATITNPGAANTALKINANAGIGIDVDPASVGILMDATVAGMQFVGSQPAIGIDISNGATDGLIYDAAVFGVGTGVSLGATNAPGTGMSIDADANGIIVGASNAPDIGTDVTANLIGSTIDANVIGLDIGQVNAPTLGVGIVADDIGIDILTFNDDGIVIDAFSDGIQIDNAGADGVDINNVSDNGIEMDAIGNEGILMDNVAGNGIVIEQVGNDGISIDGPVGGNGIDINSFGLGNIGLNIANGGQSITTDGANTLGDGIGNDDFLADAGAGSVDLNSNAAINLTGTGANIGITTTGLGTFSIANTTGLNVSTTGVLSSAVGGLMSDDDFLPNITNTYDLGSAALVWDNLFVNTITLPGMTPGSVVFIGAANQLAQDNANFFFDDATNSLSINTGAAPTANLQVAGTVDFDGGDVTFPGGATRAFFNNATGNLNMNSANFVTNIGNAGTDFDGTGGLTLAGVLDGNAAGNTIGSGAAAQQLTVVGTADAVMGNTLGLNPTVWDLVVQGDVVATGLIKAGGSLWIDAVSATHNMQANAPLNITTTGGANDIGLVPGGGDVNVTGNIVPSVTNTYSLGAPFPAGPVWNNIYTNTITLPSGTFPAGSVIFADASGQLDADGVNFNYDDVTNSLTVAGNLSVGGTGTFTGALTANSTVTVSGALTANGAVTTNSSVTNNGAVTNTSTMTTGGAATFNGAVTNNSTLTNNGAVTNTSTMTTGGAATFNGAVTNTSTTTLGGATTANGVLTANGASTFNAALTANSGATINGLTGLSANTNILVAPAVAGGAIQTRTVASLGFVGGSGTVNTIPVWTGATTLGDAPLTVTGGTNISVTNNLSVGGTTTLTGALTANGAVTNNSTLTNNGAVTNTSTMTTTGAATFNGAVTNNSTLTNNGAVTNTSTMTTTGAATFNGAVTNNSTLTNNGAVTNTSTMTTGGAATFNGAVSNTSTTTLGGATTANGAFTANAAATFNGAFTANLGATINGLTGLSANTNILVAPAAAGGVLQTRTVASLGLITGAGTANTITMWSGPATLTDAPMTAPGGTNISVTNNLSVGGTTTLTGAVTANGAVTNNSTLTNNGAVTNTSTMTTTGAATFNGAVTNSSTLTNNGAVTNTSTMTTGGAATFNGAVSNTSTTTLGGATTANGVLTANGASTFNAALTANSGATINGLVNAPGSTFVLVAPAAAGGTVGTRTVASLGLLTGTGTANTITMWSGANTLTDAPMTAPGGTNISVTNNLSVGGSTTLTGAATANGALTANGAFTANAASTFTSGATVASGNFAVTTGNITAGSGDINAAGGGIQTNGATRITNAGRINGVSYTSNFTTAAAAANYNVVATDYFIHLNAGAITNVNFQSAGTEGRIIVIRNNTGAAVTLTPNGGDAIDVANIGNNVTLTFISDGGTNWYSY